MNVYHKIQQLYNSTVRDLLPEKNRKLTGVNVQDTPLFDIYADNPTYKIGLILAIYDYVSEGDSVEIVGFGRGVTTTHIFQAGASQVVGYEGAPKMIKKGVDTVKQNIGEINSMRIKHAIVGDPIDVYGDFSDAKTIPPAELAMGDILVLDCEGAEISILSNLGNYPDTVICESHPTKGSPSHKVSELLEENYVVSTRSQKPAPDTKEVVIGTQHNGC